MRDLQKLRRRGCTRANVLTKKAWSFNLVLLRLRYIWYVHTVIRMQGSLSALAESALAVSHHGDMVTRNHVGWVRPWTSSRWTSYDKLDSICMYLQLYTYVFAALDNQTHAKRPGAASTHYAPSTSHDLHIMTYISLLKIALLWRTWLALFISSVLLLLHIMFSALIFNHSYSTHFLLPFTSWIK